MVLDYTPALTPRDVRARANAPHPDGAVVAVHGDGSPSHYADGTGTAGSGLCARRRDAERDRAMVRRADQGGGQ